MHGQRPSLWVYLTALLTLLFASHSALAAKVAKVSGSKVMINLEGDAAKEGDIFVVWNPAGKKVGLVKIKAVRDNRAIGTLGKGKAESGWTIKISEKPVKATKGKVAKTKGTGESETHAAARGGSRWGVMGGIVSDSLKVKLADGSTVALSGMAFSVKGVFDYNLFGPIWFRGLGGLEGLSGKGPTAAGCESGKTCEVSIYYLAGDFMGRVVFPESMTSKLWAGGGISLMFPVTKSATAIETSSITNTSTIVLAGGIDWVMSPTMTIPIQVEYGLFPKSETVTASALAIRAGFLMPF